MKPKITIYIPCHNYGRYLREAVNSVIAQISSDWELIVISDGSTDDSLAIAREYAAQDPERIRAFEHPEALGLQASANRALEASRGDYIMRLDADDYLDESACLVMAEYLDRHPDIGLVYPNYIYVDEAGSVLGIEARKKVGADAKLLDLPAHGACTMVRKRVLKAIGGYSEKYKAQDGHELWLKVLHRYQIANVNTPLFYYRQHSLSLSTDHSRLLTARAQIKRDLVESRKGQVTPRTLAVIPAKNTYAKLPNVVLNPIAGKPLIDYTIEAASQVAALDAILVTTDDPAIAEHCDALPHDIQTQLRPQSLSEERVHLSQVVANSLEYMEQKRDFHADIVLVLSVHSPLRRTAHIQKAIDTLILYNTDSVISVYEDSDSLFRHGTYGLEPLNPGMHNQLRLEREALYVDNGAIKAMWRDVVTPTDISGRKVGHIVMTFWDSWQIKEPNDIWLVEQLVDRAQETI